MKYYRIDYGYDGTGMFYQSSQIVEVSDNENKNDAIGIFLDHRLSTDRIVITGVTQVTPPPDKVIGYS